MRFAHVFGTLPLRACRPGRALRCPRGRRTVSSRGPKPRAALHASALNMIGRRVMIIEMFVAVPRLAATRDSTLRRDPGTRRSTAVLTIAGENGPETPVRYVVERCPDDGATRAQVAVGDARGELLDAGARRARPVGVARTRPGWPGAGDGLVVAIEHDDQRPARASASRAQPHQVDGAQAGVGHQHDDVGLDVACTRVDRVAVAGQRRPHAAGRLDEPDVDAARATPSRPPARRWSGPDGRGRRRPSAAPSATSYQRCGGQTVVGASPVAAAETRRRRWVRSPGSNDWAGLRAATGRPPPGAGRAGGPPTQVLPTSVPVPATSTSRSGRLTARPVGGGDAEVEPGVDERARRAAATSSAVWAALKAMRRREVPGGTVGRPDGRHQRARAQAASAAAAHRVGFVADRRPGGSASVHPGASRSTWARSRARSSSPSALRTIAEGGRGRGHVGRRRRGGEDERAGPVHEQLGEAVGVRRRSRRAIRASWTACPCAARRRRRARRRRGRVRARRGPRRAPAGRRDGRTRRSGRRPARRRRPSRTRGR